MNPFSIGMMSNEEKQSILDQHKHIYDGWRTMQPKVSNEQPLYVQDFANDKVGVTVTNKFDVKGYTNIKINESSEKKEMCSECGSSMSEGECSECGWKGEMGEEMQQVKDLDNFEDLGHSKFDYVENEIDEIDISMLKKGNKYKYKHPSPDFDDTSLEFEDEYESDDDKVYQFKGKSSHVMPKKGVEDFIDLFDEDVDVDSMDMSKGEYSQSPHQVQAPDGMGDLGDSGIDHEDEISETQQGDPYYNEKGAYNFVSGGPSGGHSLPNYSDDDDEDDDSEYVMRSAFDEIEDTTEIEYNDETDEDFLDGIDDTDDADVIVDEQISESVAIQKNRIIEMMNRMKSF